MKYLKIQSSTNLKGSIEISGAKNAALPLLASTILSKNELKIGNLPNVVDINTMVKLLEKLGANYKKEKNSINISTINIKETKATYDIVKTMRASILVLGPILARFGHCEVSLPGGCAIGQRPVDLHLKALEQMGAVIETTANGTAPLQIQPQPHLQGIDYVMPVASAQVKSSLLLAGLYAEGETWVTEPAPTRDHTERMLQSFAYPVMQQGARCGVLGGGSLLACEITVPADISSAAFFLVGASIAPGSDIILRHVGVNPTRDGVITILRLMGADIEVLNSYQVGEEPVADLRVRAAPLQGIHIPEDQVPLAIDEFPALLIAAACAEGETVLTGAAELRVKESDRIQAMADGLQALGIEAEVMPDGMVVQGGQLQGGEVDSYGDHRIAMAFAMAALRAKGEIQIQHCANVDTSFPGFAQLAASVGLAVVAEYA